LSEGADNSEFYKKAYQREKQARREAEKILEQKALELYNLNQSLKNINENLEKELEKRTQDIMEIVRFPEQNPNPVMRISGDGKALFYNFEGKIILKSLRQKGFEEVSSEFHEMVQKVLVKNEVVVQQFKLGEKYFRFTFKPIIEKNYVNIYGQDTSREVEAQIEIEKSEQKFRQLVELADDIIYQTDLTGNFTYANPQAQKLTGYDEDELLNMHFIRLLREDYQSKMMEFYMKQLSEETRSTYFEFPMITKYGKSVWLGQNVNLVYEGNQVVGIIAMARDITARIVSDTQLRNSEEKYRGILENMELGLLEVNMENRISKAYPRFCELSGYSEEELIGRIPEDFLLHQDSIKVMEKQQEFRRKGEGSVYEVQLRCKDGSYKWVAISGAPFYDFEGKQEGSLGIHLDISNHRRLEEELKKANEMAVASSKAKELFLANMSHEIRTPLNAVIGITQLLARSKLDPKQKNYVDTISKSADNLLLLVNNILDVSKIEANSLELEYVSFDLKKTLDHTISSLHYMAKSKGLGLKLLTNDTLRSFYVGDQLRLSQILINLINNAIKFTKEGMVNILVEAEDNKDGSHQITFQVKDTGIGISQEAQKKIFEDFTQASNATSRKYGGTGLGLSICRELVALYGAELKVNSEEGKGSTFYFTLKMDLADTENFADEEILDSELDWSGIKILVAEDNKVNQFVAVNFIEGWGAKALVAENGKIAVDLTKENDDIDIILMDMQMPEMNGVEASLHIRNKLKKTLPIIALTANAIKGDDEKCLQAGMNSYLSKPFKEEDLKSEIRKFIIQDKMKDTKIENSTGGYSTLRLQKIEQMADGNEAFKLKMLKLFLDEGYLQLKTFEENTDVETLASTAHKMKPSIDYLADDETISLVRKIENKEFVQEPALLHRYIFKLTTLLDEVETYLNS
jgi:PAS domain S-box-containing protein